MNFNAFDILTDPRVLSSVQGESHNPTPVTPKLTPHWDPIGPYIGGRYTVNGGSKTLEIDEIDPKLGRKPEKPPKLGYPPTPPSRDLKKSHQPSGRYRVYYKEGSIFNKDFEKTRNLVKI